MLKEYTKDNYYARFDILSYHCCRETYLTLPYLCQSQWSMNSRSRSPGQCVCSEYTKDNYYARFDILSYHCCRETHLTSHICQSHWTMKCNFYKVNGMWKVGQGHNVCLISIQSSISMQGLTLAAIPAAETHFNVNC